MPPAIKKGISATILSFLGSSLIMGIVVFFLKDTLDRLNSAVIKSNDHQVQMVKIGSSLNAINVKMDDMKQDLDKHIDDNSDSFDSLQMIQVANHDKIVHLEYRCINAEKAIGVRP